MRIKRRLWLAAAAISLLGAAACGRPAPTPSPPSEAPAALEPASTEAHAEVTSASAAAPTTETASAPTAASGGGAGGCITTYVGGSFHPGFNGAPSTYTPGQPMTVCSPPPLVKAPAPVAIPLARAAAATPAPPQN